MQLIKISKTCGVFALASSEWGEVRFQIDLGELFLDLALAMNFMLVVESLDLW